MCCCHCQEPDDERIQPKQAGGRWRIVPLGFYLVPHIRYIQALVSEHVRVIKTSDHLGIKNLWLSQRLMKLKHVVSCLTKRWQLKES